MKRLLIGAGCAGVCALAGLAVGLAADSPLAGVLTGLACAAAFAWNLQRRP